MADDEDLHRHLQIGVETNDKTLKLNEPNKSKHSLVYYFASCGLVPTELSLMAFSTWVRSNVHVHACRRA